MPDYTKPLGDAIRSARTELGLTQTQVADRANIDPRTVLNIEHYKGNPKMEVLYPLIRALNLDSNTVFYPEHQCEVTAITRLQFLVGSCSELEADLLYGIVQSVIDAMRKQNSLGV